MTRFKRARSRSKHRHLGFWQSRLISALAAVGILLSLYLTYAHHRLQTDPSWQSVCAISERINCDKVVSSEFGSILQVPLSVIGGWFYGLVALFSLLGASQRVTLVHSPALLLFGASVLAGTVSTGLAIASWSIGAVCLFCVALYAVNGGLLLVTWRALRDDGEALADAVVSERAYWRRHKPELVAYLCAALAPLAVTLVGYNLRTGPSLCEIAAGLRRSNANVPLVLEVFIDYQCPHCRALDRQLRRLRDEPGIIINARHFPLEKDCNPHMKRARHPGACLQARAAICAETQGKIAAYSTFLFDSASADRHVLVTTATSLGMNGSNFEDCIDAPQTADALQRDIQDAISRRVLGTPTIFLNGSRYPHSITVGEVDCLRRLS